MGLLKVLIVEDNPLALEINQEFLREDPDFICAGTASSGQEALECIQRNPPDLVLLDHMLPDYNGTALIEKVRAFDKRIDFIMITAAKEVPVVQESFRLGIRDYLIKPFLKERFLQALKDYKRFLGIVQAETCEQRDVDAIARGVERADQTLPEKGISGITRDKILGYLRENAGGKTADEVARGVGLSTVAARHYLNNLVDAGRVRMDLQYGSLGRPRYVYTLYGGGGA